MNHPGDRAKALSPIHIKQTSKQKYKNNSNYKPNTPKKGGRMLMTDAGTVNILSWISTFVNLILIALIPVLCVTWTKIK